MSTDVQYGEVAVATEMPAGGGRRSPLYGLVNDIIEDPEKWNTARCIANYAEKTPASGAANVLRAKYGRKIEDKGLEFAVRKVNITDENGNTYGRNGLWVYYDPEAAVEGEWEKHVSAERAKAHRANEKAKAKAQEKRAAAA